MIGLRGGIILAVLVGAVGAGVYFRGVVASNKALRADIAALEASQQQQKTVNNVLVAGMTKQTARVLEYESAFEELRNVKDDNSCRSPAVDRAFDILQRRRTGQD